MTQAAVQALAPTQLALLAAEAWARDPAEYTLVSGIRVEGLTDVRCLENAVREVMGQHDVFTWKLGLGKDYSITATRGTASFCVETMDLSDRADAEAHQIVTQFLAQERHRPIRLLDRLAPSTGSACVSLFKMPATADDRGQPAVCILTTHHVYLDERSVQVLWSQIVAAAIGRPPVVDSPFSEWVAAQHHPRNRAAARQAADELAAWLRAGAVGGPRCVSAPSPGTAAGSHRTPILADLQQHVRQAAAAAASSISSIYALAAVQALHPLMDAERFPVWMPMSRRAPAEHLNTVGCFVTSLPVLITPDCRDQDPSAALLAWEKGLAFARERTHADLTYLHRQLPRLARAALYIESPGQGRISGLRWHTLAMPDGPAKEDLVIYLGLPSKAQLGQVRVGWRDGIDPTAARGLGAAIVKRARTLGDQIRFSRQGEQ